MRMLLLLLTFPFLMSCEKLSNRLNSRILDCGESARDGGPWIKVLDPQGQELAAMEQLDARALELNAAGNLPPALPVSEKHCVNTRGTGRIVIRSLAQDRSWSALVKTQDDPSLAFVRLQDNSQARVRLRCPDPWIQNGRFQLPLEVNAADGLEAWAFAPRLFNAEGREAEQNFSLESAGKTLLWPEAWPDGPGQLFLKQKNLLQNPRSALAEVEESCPFIIDRQAPALSLTPAPQPGKDLDMPPGALLLLKIVDPHPALLRWCLQPMDHTQCENPQNWQTVAGEVSLPMPDQGRWVLKAEAKDAAGNSSEALQQVIDIVRRDLLQGISARVDQALAEKNEKGWEAGQSLLRALSDYQRLSIDKEKNQVRAKLVDGILGAAPYLQEYQRANLASTGNQAWAVDQSPDSPWLVLSDADLSLWSARGQLLQKIPVPYAWAADWSPATKSLALGTAEDLWVMQLVDAKFSEPMKLRWMDHKDINSEPDALQWIPGTRQMVITFPNSEPAVVNAGPEGLTLTQRLTSFNNRQLAVAADGSRIATVDGDSVIKLWSTSGEAWVQTDKSDELSVAGLSFAGGGATQRLIVLLKDGRLISWSPGVLWKDIDSASGEIPTESASGIKLQYVQAWGDGSTGLMERGGRFYEWSTVPGKTLQPLKFSGFSWENLRNWKVDPCQRGLWMQDDRSLSYWEWQDAAEPGFKKLGDWPLGTQRTSFAVRCDQDRKNFVTMTGSRLRFWSQRTPLPQIRGDRSQVVVSRFEDGREEGETLFTAGFDGVIRLWDRSGQKLQEWIGHTAQINEVRFLTEWNLFVSSAEDFTSRLWTRKGEMDANLSLEGVASAAWRDAALAFDNEHMLTAGKGVLAFWFQNSNRKELTITIPFESGERPGFDALVRLPGSPRILVRLMKGHVGRALVVTPDGSLVTEAGLPPLQKLRWIEWTRDGARLAIGDAQQKARIFRNQSGQWVEEALAAPANLSRFSFAPDGTRFAALRGGSLVIGQRDSDQWSILQDIPLTSTNLDKGLQWTSDSSRLIYAQAGLVSVRSREGSMEHQFQAFPGTDSLNSMGLSHDPDILAVGSGPWVRIVDLNLDRLQSQLCSWLEAWIQSPDAPPEFSVLCTK
ncbi:MAG TPA: WD40 repeat domain-containing protein [Oligoflexus sp.]|uniref:WD40 repeat domain-containing protein n=1 Tax=Oligoflexus sp. TaxID=1971216 RepID=UPI002D7F9469|nr:WD40 repeat domain-containing protein [Oligoflexus sp.]HET9238308.1 WD40 repeat domain-containing protein [Oligoflexus sp.]